MTSPGGVREQAVRSLSAEIVRAADALSSASEVALACHVNPDADAVGSMLGLGRYLSSRGKAVACSWGNEPFTLPRWMRVLDAGGLVVEPALFPERPGLMVALDTASPDRLGSLGRSADRADELIVVDHHASNPGFGSITVFDPEASSTAEVVFRILERMGGDLPDEAAACLYAGVVTDTGRFQYEATTPETLRVAAELRHHAFDHARMAQVLFEDNSLSYLRFLAVPLARVRHEPAADLVWTYVTQGDLASTGAELAETDDLIDVVRTAREADVACVVKQQKDGRFRVSLRSRGSTDVGAVALVFGGGGHRLAAGYTSTGGVADTVERLVAALQATQEARSLVESASDGRARSA